MDRTQAGIVTLSVVGILLILLFGNPLKIRVKEETESTGATQTANPSAPVPQKTHILRMENTGT